MNTCFINNRTLKIALILTVIVFNSCIENETKTVQEEASLPIYNDASFTPIWLENNNDKNLTIHNIPSFQFTNQLGDTVTEKTFTNKIYVANFFFTTCPGICKKLSNNLIAVQQVFKEDTDILLLSHSVTPEKDSTSVLLKYAKQYGIINNKWHLVTGNRSAIYSIARNGYFADEDLGVKKDETDFLHTENIVLIDKLKRIRGVYKGTSEIEILNLIADIKRLKKEI